MPFLRAGFNWRHRSTGVFGWTRPASGGRFEPAELIAFTPKGPYTADLAWLHHAKQPRFLAWGENVVLGSHWGFDLPFDWQYQLPQSNLQTHRTDWCDREESWLQ